MNKSNLFFIPTILVLTLGGCTPNNTQREFYVVNMPNKTSFNVGEEFTLDGLVLADKDQLSITITDYQTSIQEGYVFTLDDVGQRQVTISKNNYKSIKYSIEVTNLEELEISTYPRQEFIYGEYFSYDGLVVTAGGVEVTGYAVSMSTAHRLFTLGTFTVEISKSGYQSAFYDITVYPQRSLSINSLPNQTEYDDGDEFSSEGLVVINEREEIVTDYTLSIPDGTILKGAGNKTVIVSKEGYESTSFTLKVNEKQIPDPVNHTIDIYYINDTHGSYTRLPAPDYEGGMANISSYIKTNVSNNPTYSIVLSGGDMFQGGYESNETHGQIMIDSMNEIGFDAMVIGNHEFDWGENYVRTFSETLNCTMISSNIFYADGETRPTWANPYVILDKGDVRVGIIGGATENMGTSIVGSVSNSFAFPSPNTYIRYYSDILRNSHGCDIIIAALHDAGFSGSSGNPTAFSDLTNVSPNSGCKYVDAMFFAHDHIAKKGVYQDVPYLESGGNGRYVGHMSLELEGNGVSYTVTNYATENTYGYTNCPNRDDNFDAIDERYATIISKGNEEVYNFANAYTSDEFTVVVCMAMLWYVNAHKADFDNTTVSMASHNSGGVRDDVKKGIMKLRDFIKIFPFDNYLSIQRCSQYNINRYNNYDYYVTYGTPTYEDDGYARVASINYITEKSNASYYQVDYKNYDITVKTILYAYLTGGVNNSL